MKIMRCSLYRDHERGGVTLMVEKSITASAG